MKRGTEEASATILTTASHTRELPFLTNEYSVVVVSQDDSTIPLSLRKAKFSATDKGQIVSMPTVAFLESKECHAIPEAKDL